MTIHLNNPSPAGAAGTGGTSDHAALSNLDFPSAGHTGDLDLGASRLSATGITAGTLQGLIAGTGGTLFSIGSTGGAGQFLYSVGDNTYAWANTAAQAGLGTDVIVPYLGAVSDLLLNTYNFSANAITCGTLQGVVISTGGSLSAVATGGVGYFLYHAGNNTYAYASTQASLPTVTTGIISGLLPLTTDTTRYVLGGAVQLSLNTANIWATTFSGTNFYGGTYSGGTFLASALTVGTLQGIAMGTQGSLVGIATGAVGTFLSHSGGNIYAWANTQASLPTITTGIISGLLPITTNNTRYALGGAVQLSLNTANIWATTFSGTTLRATTVTCSSFYSTSTSVVFSAANPILTVAGQVGVDVTTTSGSTFRFYSDAEYCLPAYQSKSFCLVSPAGAGTYMLWRTPYTYTLKNVYALCSGGSVTGALYKADGNGANCVTATINAAITGTTTTASNIVAGVVSSGCFLNWITTATGGTPTRLVVSWNYAVSSNA